MIMTQNYCMKCHQYYGQGIVHVCNEFIGTGIRPAQWPPVPQTIMDEIKPASPTKKSAEGWICPVCKGGVAPGCNLCPCTKQNGRAGEKALPGGISHTPGRFIIKETS